jgi:hypothetical protein
MSVTLFIFAVILLISLSITYWAARRQPRRAIFTPPTVGSPLHKMASPLPEIGAVRLRFSDLPG